MVGPGDPRAWLTALIASGSMVQVYLSFFVVMTLSGSIIPIPTDAFYIVALGLLDPVTVFIISAAAIPLGALLTYALARWSRELLTDRVIDARRLDSFVERVEAHDFPLILFVFSATPLPIDVAVAAAGVIRYDLVRFFAITLAGRGIRFIALTAMVMAGRLELNAPALLAVRFAIVVPFIAVYMRYRHLISPPEDDGVVDGTEAAGP